MKKPITALGGVALALALSAGSCDDSQSPAEPTQHATHHATAQGANGGLTALCNKVSGDSGSFSDSDIPASGLSMALRGMAKDYALYHTNKDRLLQQCRNEGWQG